MAKMQFIFDLIWTQSCNRYLASMGQQEAQQWSRSPPLFSRCLVRRYLRLTRWMPIALVKPTGPGDYFVCGATRGIDSHGQTSECRGHKRPKNPGSGIPRDDGCRTDGSHCLLGGLRDSPVESTFKRPISWRDRSRASWFQLGRDRS